MTCEICGRGACMKSFHSIDEQQSFDDVADDIKERLANTIRSRVDRLDTYWGNDLEEDQVYVKLDDVLDVIWNSY